MAGAKLRCLKPPHTEYGWVCGLEERVGKSRSSKSMGICYRLVARDMPFLIATVFEIVA